MALSRRLLKSMGIDEEKIDQIIEAHSETVDALKTERDNYKEKAEKFESTQKELNKLKEKTAEQAESGNQSATEIENLRAEITKLKAENTARETREAKEKAVREILTKVGISEKHTNSIVRVMPLDTIELDKEGKVKNAQALEESVKADFSDFIQTINDKKHTPDTPPNAATGTKLTKADIYKKDESGRYIMNAAERQKALIENQII